MAAKPTLKRSAKSSPPDDTAPLACSGLAEWHAWLQQHHASSTGVWLLVAKKDGGRRLVTYAEAVEGALIWGWIDGQKQRHDAAAWLQRFTPRTARSPWSKINRDKAELLQAAGRLAAPGLAEIERAQRDGRWTRAYDGARTASVPDDLAAALAAAPKAAAFFATIDGANRYAVLYRVHQAKLATTRARRIADFVAMLARGETIHAPRKRR